MKPIEQSEKLSGNSHYPPSFIDRLMRFVQRLPLPYWLTYLLFFIVQSLVKFGLAWADDSLSALEYPQILFLYPVWQWVPLLILTYLNRTASRTLDSFSRLLDSQEFSLEELKEKFTTMPPRGVIMNSLFWGAFYAALNYSFFSLYSEFGIGKVTQYVLIVEGLLCFSIGGVIYYHSVRQLWLVSQTVKMVKRYNLFDLDPVYSLSRLTAWTGISWVLLLILNLWLFPFGEALELMLFITVLQVTLALAAFVLPLRFVNHQLVVEKRRLLAENQQRVEGIFTSKLIYLLLCDYIV
jgi:hypothetical protein